MWLVIRLVICRSEWSQRMFWLSGSENGPVPRKSEASGFVLAPGPPQSPP